MSHEPTPSEVFDLCQRLFGIGDYDDDAKADVPYFKVRMNEIGKLKRIMSARRIEPRALLIAANYCHEQGIAIRATGELIAYITPAYVHMRERERAEKREALRIRRTNVVESAYEMGNDYLATRVIRMTAEAFAAEVDQIEKDLGLA